MPKGVGVQIPPGAPYFFRSPHRLSVRTSGSHPGKRGSTPLGGAILANVAQLVEQFIRNEQVVRSIRIVGSIVYASKVHRVLVSGFFLLKDMEYAALHYVSVYCRPSRYLA